MKFGSSNAINSHLLTLLLTKFYIRLNLISTENNANAESGADALTGCRGDILQH